MKAIKTVTALAVFAFIVSAPFAAFAAVTMTVGSATVDADQQAQIDITADDPVGIAGAAFTLEYDTSALTVTVDSSFFDTFANQFADAGTPAGYPTEVEVDGVTYYQPLITNGVTGTGMRIAAARCTPADNSNSMLFTLTVSLNAGTAFGTYPITVVATTLNNTDAGYAPEGETIPMLVGADASKEVTDPAAFPILLDPPNTVGSTVPGGVTFLEVFVDTDNDTIHDQWEIEHFGGLNTADDTTDADEDGYLEKFEQPVEYHGNGTDPNVQDEPFGPNYDPATDNRAPYQRITTNPTAPKAGAGDSFSMDINYTTTDNNQTLTGLGLCIHYDSTKLTWSSFSEVLATAKIGEDSTPVEDTADYDNDPSTDKYLTVAWLDVGGNWPNADLPAKLYVVNFTANEGLQEGESSVIRFTESSSAAGYTFYGPAVTFEVGTPFNLDVDGNGTSDALTDGLLIIRYLFGFRGDPLIVGAVAGDCTTCTASEIEAYIEVGVASLVLDVDGNGTCDALTDGLLIIRYLFGFRGDPLIVGAVAGDCTRCTASEIEAYLLQILP